MKNTKKILMIFCSIAVLFATVFATIATAVVAGENTSINEYATMKITASHGFEDGTNKVLFGGVANADQSGSSKDACGGVYIQNNGVRRAVKAIYGDEDSIKYYVINYDANKNSADLYIQPKLGVLDEAEKTPVNGFVAEFDISFMTAVEVEQQQAVDEDGELKWEIEATDPEGNPIYKLDEDGQKIPVMENAKEPLLTDQIKVDYEGNIVYKVKEYVQDTNEDGSLKWEEDETGGLQAVMIPIYEQATDEEGNPLWELEYDENGAPVVDENGDPVYKLDEKGEKIPVRIPEYQEVLDENGEVVMVDKVTPKEWTGLSTSFGIGMYNTHTYKDGKVDLLSFTTDKATKTITLSPIANNLLPKEEIPEFSFAADEWCHIAVQFDAKSLLTYIYAGRDDSEFDLDGDGVTDVYGRLLLGIKKCNYVIESGETVDVYPLQFRFGCKSTSGVVGFDNFIGYQGTTIHDPTLLNNRLPYEKYLYLAEILENATQYKAVKDSDGNVVYQVVTDENGNTVYVPSYEYATDENGNVIYVQKKNENGELVWELDDLGALKLDENGNKIPVYATDTDGNKIPAYEKDENGEYVLDVDGNKIPVYEKDENGNLIPVYVVDSFGEKVPVFELDENGNKIVEVAGESFVDRYHSFNLLATNEELRKVYTKENFGGEPDVDELEALEHAFALYDVYAQDKKNNTGSTSELYSCYYEMVQSAKLENAATYLSYANEVLETERKLENYSDRRSKILKAEEFYNSVGSLIERDANGDYGKATKILDEMTVIVAGDEAAYNFVNAMKIFDNSIAYGATAKRIKTHYENASYYYPNICKDYTDPATTLIAESVQQLADAVASYKASADIVSGNIKEYNASRFVGIIGMMQKKSTGAWAQDGAEVEALWLRALDIILDDNYDDSSDDFAVAKIMFDSANKYFWDKMQKNHIKNISDKLDSYNDPDMTYIDKAGICTYVDRYIQANARYLDLDSIEITREISRNEAYKLQLDTLVGDYQKLLVENAPRFISVMKMSKHYSTYADLKPLYDEATKYYYTMNIEGEGIEECLADYEELRALITSIERDSQAYIDIILGNVKDGDGNAIFKPMSEITDKKELYASLKEAYLCFENLDITYPGAREAKATYDAKYQEYNDATNKINTELANGESVVYASRGNWSFDTVVIFVKKLINKKG